jgi:hypothetical protein
MEKSRRPGSRGTILFVLTLAAAILAVWGGVALGARSGSGSDPSPSTRARASVDRGFTAAYDTFDDGARFAAAGDGPQGYCPDHDGSGGGGSGGGGGGSTTPSSPSTPSAPSTPSPADGSSSPLL